MGFTSLVSSRLESYAMRSASDFVGIGRNSRVCALFPNKSVGGSTTKLDERSEGQFAERTRIAQELHDTLLQGFFAVSMQLHAAVEYLPADSAAKPRFGSVLQAMDRVLEEGRRAVQGLRSPHEHAPSLGEALAGAPNDLGLPSTLGFRVAVEGRQREFNAER